MKDLIWQLLIVLGLLSGFVTGRWYGREEDVQCEPVTLTRETRVEAARRIEGIRKHQLQQDRFVPRASTIFLGDSITAGLATNAVTPNAVNYGIGGQTTEALLQAMPDYTSVQRAKLVVLSIGTVDLVSGRTIGLDQRLAALADAIPGPMLWNAVPPTTHADVRSTNATIRQLCAAKPGCTFVQAPITPLDLMADGTHLLPSGYEKWIDAMRETGK